jgi:hypothetical protein
MADVPPTPNAQTIVVAVAVKTRPCPVRMLVPAAVICLRSLKTAFELFVATKLPFPLDAVLSATDAVTRYRFPIVKLLKPREVIGFVLDEMSEGRYFV